jgi:hypothetical protein
MFTPISAMTMEALSFTGDRVLSRFPVSQSPFADVVSNDVVGYYAKKWRQRSWNPSTTFLRRRAASHPVGISGL